jgi:predicted metal-dependent hydrolase
VRDHLRAGCALFNDGYHHAAHDAWEDRWLALDRGTDDERFLHGLIQFTACVHHLDEGNIEGAVGLAESAGEYLDGLGDPYHGVALGPVRDFLDRVTAASGSVDPREAPALRHEGEVRHLADLAFPAAAVAAPILADAEGLDPDPVVAAAELARDGTDSPFAGLVHDFVRQEATRSLIHDRLRRHVERQELADDAVDALFDG